MKVYFIRHGQSEGNLKGIIQGHADFPLSSMGKRQAVLVGDYLSGVGFDAIYCSDLQRAYDTAQAVGDYHDVVVQSWDVVREVGLGPLEGLKREELLERYPQLRGVSLLTSGIAGTESLGSITARCQLTMRYLLESHREDTVAVVSHGGFISIMLMYLLLGEEWSSVERPFVIGNTGITEVDMDGFGKITFRYVNKMTHLEGGDKVGVSSVLY